MGYYSETGSRITQSAYLSCSIMKTTINDRKYEFVLAIQKIDKFESNSFGVAVKTI